MRIIIIGAGAVGGYFGGRLAESGVDVAFLTRGRTMEVLSQTGLLLSSPTGTLHLRDIEASDDPNKLAPADAVIVAVKAWQVPGIAKYISPLLLPDGCVLPLQNGVDAPAQLQAVLGDKPVLGGLCKILCQLESPGHIRHLGGKPFIALGELDDRTSERVTRLRDALAGAGVVAKIPASIRAAMWEKFMFICAVSALGAATRMPIGVLVGSPETRGLLVSIMEEICAVARALDISLSPDLVGRTMAFLETLPASSTASMQRDIMEGRPSELEAQNGAVVRIGREVGVPTPVNELLFHLLLPMERQARSVRKA